MPEELTGAEIPVPDPSSGGADTPSTGDDPMAKTAGEVDATIDKVLDQSFAKTHESWLSQAERENAAAGFLAEVTRLTFGAAASMQVQLAGGILAQRSAQSQPGQGVIPATKVIGQA